MIQLTWHSNYDEFEKWLKINYPEFKNIDILKNPDLLATNNELAILSAMWFWGARNINAEAGKENVKSVTLKINSAALDNDKRKEVYDKLKEKLK